MVSLDHVPLLIEGGTVKGADYMKAVSFLRDSALWTRWAIRALFALAIGHLLSGIVFFFAFNWNDLSGMMKFAIIGGGILASLAAWVIAKLDSPVGQAFGISATVLVGVMFAVLGQVYQTPAMIHTPFVFWAALTLPFALASRNLAHWTVWIVILTVAMSAYANSGLRLAGNDSGANILNIIVSGGFITALVVLDKLIAPRMSWARAEWFRVLLVLGAVGFAFFGFTESLWSCSSHELLWSVALGLVGALIAYLFYRKPSLATLSLATFGAFALIAQFGFKLFEGFNDGVGVLFLIFIWLGGLTAGMVVLFRRYILKFRTVETIRPDGDVSVENKSVTTAEFSSHMQIDQIDVDGALSSRIAGQPWYMSAFLAIAGVLTAILGCLFFGSLVGIFLTNADEIVFGILGAIIFSIAIFLRRKSGSEYLQHLLNTMIIIGGILAGIGFGLEIKNFDSVIVLLLGLSLIVLCLVRDRILEFLSAAAIITLIGFEFYHLKLPMIESITLIVSTCLGLVLLTQPIRKRLLNAAGTAFLMAPAILGIALVHAHRWDSIADSSRFSDDWPARLIALVVLLGGVTYLNRGSLSRGFKPPLMVLMPIVIAAAMMPLGGASALLLMLAGYILGSRSLAIIGTLLQIYFLTMFYYDLSLDLLTKSIILFASGLIFLAVWHAINRKEEAAS